MKQDEDKQRRRQRNVRFHWSRQTAVVVCECLLNTFLSALSLVYLTSPGPNRRKMPRMALMRFNTTNPFGKVELNPFQSSVLLSRPNLIASAINVIPPMRVIVGNPAEWKSAKPFSPATRGNATRIGRSERDSETMVSGRPKEEGEIETDPTVIRATQRGESNEQNEWR